VAKTIGEVLPDPMGEARCRFDKNPPPKSTIGPRGINIENSSQTGSPPPFTPKKFEFEGGGVIFK
jgi:hypothetical protein